MDDQVNREKTMPHFELLFTQDFDNAADEIKQHGGRVTQKFSDSVFEAVLPASTDPASALKSIDLAALKYSAPKPSIALDEHSQASVTLAAD
jgi:hypothetical protein